MLPPHITTLREPVILVWSCFGQRVHLFRAAAGCTEAVMAEVSNELCISRYKYYPIQLHTKNLLFKVKTTIGQYSVNENSFLVEKMSSNILSIRQLTSLCTSTNNKYSSSTLQVRMKIWGTLNTIYHV